MIVPSTKHTPEKWRRFVEAYARTGNGTKAAIEAGYSPKGAHVRGSELLRRRKVQELLAAKDIQRDIHSRKTYENLCLLADIAMKKLADAITGGADFDTVAKAIEGARRVLETMGKVDGLFVERIAFQDNRELTLQRLIEEFSKAARLQSRPVIDVPPISGAADLEKLVHEKPTNGNGNGHHEEERDANGSQREAPPSE